MARPYSMDLRERVMSAVCGGLSYKEAVARFRVSNSSILRWARRLRETGSFAALPMGGKKPFVLAEQREWIQERLTAKPDLTLRALLGELHDRGIEVCYFALWNATHRDGISFKKKRSTPASKSALTLRASATTGSATRIV